MEFRTGSADFSAPLRGSGPRTVTQPVVFPRTIRHAVAGLAGYTLAYQGDDHHVGRLECRLETELDDNVAVVTATLGVRDWSGDWDDNYQGNVQFSVLAELASVTDVPPRGDVLVTGMELNQAVQFFRASSYLDPVHALPDNAIRLVGRKDTGVRVYVDYDASAGLPPIALLTGSLHVETGSTVLDLTPINPGGSVTPMPDALINMALADHTLNFMIPAAWCEGTVTLTCQVWDQASPASKSAVFERTTVFTDVRPLNIYVVGVAYTAVTPNLAAPTQAQFTTQSLPALTKTYPIGDVVQSGFTTITFGETVTGLINGSCTSGFSHLLDRLGDIRGGSSDIVVGVLPAGIVSTPGNQIGGCGRGGLAAVFLDLPGDLPHEVGHSLGRRHAPCTMNRCNPAPANVDSGYPQYGTFPSDSIGVFGFDPTENTVFDPAATFDFMAYSFPQWVSAYTYTALAGASFPPTSGPGSGGGGGAVHLQNVYGEHLYLSLTVERDGTIRRRPSFHYPGRAPVSDADVQSGLTIEFLDADGEPLLCRSLSCDCDDGCDCWPKDIREVLPWPDGTARVRIWEGRDLRYEEDVPEPPAVRIVDQRAEEDGIRVTWTTDTSYEADPWFLVHWWDRAAGVWRGVAPRQQETSALIPYRLFRRGALCIRVLATSGLATGFAEEKLTAEHPDDPDPEVVITPSSPGGGGSLHAVVLDRAGRQLPAERLTWYGGSGGEIGRGSSVDIRGLALGQQAVTAVYRGGEHRLASAGVVLDVSAAGRATIVGAMTTRPSAPDPKHTHPHPAPDVPPEDCLGPVEL